MGEGFGGSAAARRRTLVRVGALSVTAGLVATLALLTPEPSPPEAPVVAAPAFAAEPAVRVRIRTVEPGARIVVRDARLVDGPGPADATPRDFAVKNEAGRAVVDGRALEGPAVFVAAEGRACGLDDLRYRGELRVFKDPASNVLFVVNRLPLELYLEGVVLSEMSAKFPEQALLAQTVASRSYAAHKVLTMRSRPFDVTDTQQSQVYRGALDRGRALAARLVGATRGLALVYEGRVLEAVFSSTCGGATRSAAEAFGDAAPAPLGGVPCGRCDGTEFHVWRHQVRRAALGKSLGLGGPLAALEDARTLPSLRLASVALRGPKATKRLSGSELRAALGEKALSTWFTKLALEGDWLVVEGRGYGHGAGLCQVGARTLANAGDDWRAILAYYYPGAAVGRLYPPAD